jgi:hypothetical protein
MLSVISLLVISWTWVAAATTSPGKKISLMAINLMGVVGILAIMTSSLMWSVYNVLNLFGE